MALTSSEGVDKYISRKPLHHFFQEIFTHWVGLNALFNITFMSSFVQDYYSTVQGCQMKISIKSQIVLKNRKSHTDCVKARKKKLYLWYCHCFVTKKHLNYKNVIRNFLQN